MLLNAKASEQSARMVSMKNATDSAESLIDALTLEYNKLRQGNITKELLEIAGRPGGMSSCPAPELQLRKREARAESWS